MQLRRDGAFVLLRDNTRLKHYPTAFLQGPEQSLFLGFDDGVIAHFDAAGQILSNRRLMGAIQHLVLDGTQLHAWTDLSTHMQESLALLWAPRSEVLRRAAQESPGIWLDGAVSVRDQSR